MEKSIDSVMRKNLISQYLLQGAKYILPLITLVYLARVLGSDAYGLRAYVTSIMWIFQVIADFGFENSATEDVVHRGKTSKDLTFIASAVFFARILLLSVLFLVLLVVIALVPLLQRDVPFVLVCYLSVVFNTLIPNFLFMGKEDMKILTDRYLVTKTLYIVSLLLFVRSDADLLMLAILDAMTCGAAFLWTYFGAYRKYQVSIMWVSFADIWSAFKKSGFYFLSRAATTLYSSFTTFVIGIAIADTTQIAWWSLSATLINAVQQLFTPINNVLYPRTIATHDLTLIRKFSLIGGVISLVFSIGVCIFAPQILLIAGGEEYVAGADVLAIMSSIILIGYFGILYGWPTLGAFGKIKELTQSTSIAAIYHSIVLVILWQTGVLDIINVCYLRVSTEILMAGLRYYYVRKLEGELKLEDSLKLEEGNNGN